MSPAELIPRISVAAAPGTSTVVKLIAAGAARTQSSIRKMQAPTLRNVVIGAESTLLKIRRLYWSSHKAVSRRAYDSLANDEPSVIEAVADCIGRPWVCQ